MGQCAALCRGRGERNAARAAQSQPQKVDIFCEVSVTLLNQVRVESVRFFRSAPDGRPGEPLDQRKQFWTTDQRIHARSVLHRWDPTLFSALVRSVKLSHGLCLTMFRDTLVQL